MTQPDSDVDMVIAGLFDAHGPMLYHYGSGRCIVSTRVAVEICDRHGIAARAVPVAVDLPDAGLRLGFKPGGLPGHWQGHLVALVDERLVVDLTIDQISTHAAPVVPHVFEVGPAFTRGEPTPVTVGNTRLVYTAQPNDTTYQDTEDWTDDPERDRLIPIVEKRIARRRS
jgi:hypothetical protein